MGASLGFPEATRAVQLFQRLQAQGLSTEQAFARLNQELGVSRQQFNAVAQGVSAVQRIKVDGVIGLASALRTSYTAAQKFAGRMGLTAAKANAAVARIRQLNSVSATNAQKFRILQKELKLTKVQFDQLNKAADLTNDILDDTGGKSSGGGIGNVFSSLTGVANGFNEILQTVMSLKAAIAPAYDLLIGSNERLNQELLKSQANLAANNRIFENGVEITDATEKVRATRGALEEALKRVRIDTRDLVNVTSSEVSGVFQILLANVNSLEGQSEKLTNPIDAAVESTKGWTAALTSLDIPLDQARQEINSVLQGTIDANSVLAQSLGITSPMVEQWREQGVLVDKLNEKFEVYVASNKEMADSVGGYTSNIQDIFEIIAQEAGKPLGDSFVAGLREFYEWLKDNEAAIQDFSTEAIAKFMDWANVISDDVMAVLENVIPLVQDAFGVAVDEGKRALPVVKNVVVATANIAQALAPVLSLTMKLYNFLKALVMPVFVGISKVVLLISEYIKFMSKLAQPVFEFIGDGIDKITGLLDRLPKNVMEKVFGKGDEAQAAGDKVDAVGEKVEDLDGMEANPNVELQGLENAEDEIAQLKEAYDELDKSTEEAVDTANLAATERENITKQGLINQTKSKRDANDEQLASDRDRINAELAAEQEKLSQLESMQAGEGESAEEHEAKIREAKQRTADLAGELLDNELAMQEALQDRIIQGLKDELAAKERVHELAVAGVEREIAANEALEASLDRQARLMAAKHALAEAQGNLEQTYTQINLDRIERGIALQQQNGGSTIALLEKQQVLEDQMAAQKLDALKTEQANEQANLEIEIQRNELAAKRGVLQAKLNEMEAEFAKIQAQNAIAQAQAIQDKEERERALAAAQHQLEIAEQGIDLAQEGLDSAKEEVEAQAEIAELQRETLNTQQQQALVQAQAEETAREIAQAVDLANAKLDEQVSKLEQGLEQQSAMLDAQQSLAKARSDAALAGADGEIDRLNEAIKVQERLQSGDVKNANERKALERQLAALGVDGNRQVSDLVRDRQREENRAAQLKYQALLQEQEFQRQALEIDVKRQKIAAQRAILEAQIAASTAKLGVLEAEVALSQAKAQGDQAAIAAAQQMLGIAKEQAGLSEQNVQSAQEQAAQIDAIAQSQREALQAQQQGALTAIATEEKLRQAGQGVEFAQAGGTTTIPTQSVNFAAQAPTLPPIQIANDSPINLNMEGLRNDFKTLAAAIMEQPPPQVAVNVPRASGPSGGEYGAAAVSAAAI